MKILYIGHYKEFGGWSQAAKDYVLALDSIGVDVVCRNVTLTQDRKISGRLKELEDKNTDGCDICIQHVLPHHLVKTNNFKKNIAYLASESTSIAHLNWLESLKMMDEVWVPNQDLAESLKQDGISAKIAVVPHTVSTDKYKKQYGRINITGAENNFKFYYIGDANDRKNLESIITCFHSEFEKYENVSLILKTKKFGYNEPQLNDYVNNICNKVKTDIRMYPNLSGYKKDILISNEISNDQLLQLHVSCDCFVCPSHGEAWSIPSFDAMAFGNTPICSNFGGPKEFIDKSNWRTGTLVRGVYSTCKCSDSAFPDMFTGREYWFQPCEMNIRKQMRTYYESWKNDPISYKPRNQSVGLKAAEKYSYNNVANLMMEKIND
jgi:glycosyltransferase involved in cell wall biosynthesis